MSARYSAESADATHLSASGAWPKMARNSPSVNRCDITLISLMWIRAGVAVYSDERHPVRLEEAGNGDDRRHA
jgi:hypothetical protein